MIKSVTQEDIQKGDVSSVRYKFENPATGSDCKESCDIVPTVNCIQGGDVRTGKQFFESENLDKNTYVRTVSVMKYRSVNR